MNLNEFIISNTAAKSVPTLDFSKPAINAAGVKALSKESVNLKRLSPRLAQAFKDSPEYLDKLLNACDKAGITVIGL